MVLREISKTPDLPSLTQELQDLLTILCFGHHVHFDKVDLIFVYGTPFFIKEAANKVTSLLEKQMSEKVLITGGCVPHGLCLEKQKSEASLIADAISMDLKDIAIYLEENSQNTLHNVIESLKILDYRQYGKIAFVFPSHGARRGYLTLKKFLPDSLIYQAPYDACYPGDIEQITKDSWHKFDSGKRRVWGEYLRIKHYGVRENIDYNNEVRELVKRIEAITRN